MQDQLTPDRLTNRYSVGLTLEVEADTDQLAIQVARAAGKSLQGSPGVKHAWMSFQAEPLFDDSAFEQIPGQLAIDGAES